MCPQALVEVWAWTQTQDHLCIKHSAVYHSATPARLPNMILVMLAVFPHLSVRRCHVETTTRIFIIAKSLSPSLSSQCEQPL